MPQGGRNPRNGPKVSTPLSERFYTAWRESGRTLASIARSTGLSVAAVSAYVNGTRGEGGQRRTIENLELLATELGVPADETLELAGVSIKDGVAAAIEMDRTLTRRQKANLKALVREYRDR